MKKIIALIIAVGLIFSTIVLPVQAEEDKTEIGGEYIVYEAADKEKLSENDNVVVEIYAPGKSFADLEDASDFRDVLLYKEIVKAKADGSYKVEYVITYPNAVSGMCEVYAYGKGYSHRDTILYTNPNTFKTVFTEEVLPAINSDDADTLGEKLLNNNYDLYVDDEYINEAIADRAAEILIAHKKEGAVTADNAPELINKAIAIAAFEKGKISDILEEDKIFALSDSTIGDYYTEPYIMSNTREDITDRLSNIKFSSIESFYENLEEAFILSVVANPNMPNSAATVMKAFGIKGTNKQYANVTGKDYDTIAELSKAVKDSPTDSTGGGGGGGGGGSTGSKKDVGASVTGGNTSSDEGTADTPSDGVYTDLQGYDWAVEAIEYLTDAKVVNGKGDGRFYPADNVTREEFAKMVVNALDIPFADISLGFTDVIINEWYAPYIKAAYQSGVVNGYDESTFGVGENITREDMAVMIYRGALKQGISIESASEYELFADDAQLSDYAKESIYVLKYNKIISGVGNNVFSGKAFATRAEAAKMIYEVMIKQ